MTSRGIRHTFLLFLLVCFGFNTYAQYGNEWINYNQQYFKINTGKDGIYRLTYDNLVDAGFPVDTEDPRNFQVFHRGEEVSIYVSGEEDGTFDSGDYIDFFGRRNDGTQDTELYLRPSYQPHTFYNLFSDTTAFFLTPASTLGRRMALSDEPSAGLQAESHHDKEILQLHTSQFSFGRYYPIGSVNGETKLAQYDLGQGWIGNNIEKNAQTVANGTNHRDFVVDGIVLRQESEGRPQLEVQIVGFGNVLHNTRIYVGPSLDELRLIRDEFRLNYTSFGTEDQQLQWTDVSATGRLFIRVEEVGFPEFERDVVFVSYIRVTFPQEIDVQAQSGLFFNLDKPELGLARLSIGNVLERQRVYDVTDKKNPIRLTSTNVSNNSVEAVVNMASRYRTIYTEDDSKFMTPTIRRVEFGNNQITGNNYIIISHPYLSQPAGAYDDPVQAYVDYRESVEGGGHNVYYADVTKLYDEFSYGEYTPLALKRFIKLAYDQANPDFLFLIGKSRRVDNDRWRLPDPTAGTQKHLVPTLGAPGSDLAYVTGLSGREYYPALPVGRLSVNEPENVAYYLDKVKEKENTLQDSPWAKNFLHFSGGTSTAEINLFRSFVEGFGETASSDFLGANVNSIFKRNNNSVQFFNVSEEINRGVGFVTFFGHSGTQFTDIDIGNVTDNRNGYFNAGRYPAFLVNGCRGGEIFHSTSFGENWLGAENRGATNFISHTDVGIPVPLRRYTDLFYEALSDTLFMTQPIGRIQQKVISDYLDSFLLDEIGIAMLEENLLQGDPALKVFGNDKVDYIVRDEDIFIESIDEQDITATTPFFRLGVVAGNSGRTTLDSLTIGVRRILPDGTIRQLPEVKIPAVRYQDTVYYDISNQGVDAFGDNTFEVTLDAGNDVLEGSEDNNTASLTVNFPASGTFNTSPAAYALINTNLVELVVQSAELRLNDKQYYIEIDTTTSFNSPWFKSNVVDGKGIGVWSLDISDANMGRDTVQYYWRSVFVDEINEDPRPYANSSFTFIRNGVEGWGQTEFDQFNDLELVSLQRDQVSREWILVGSQTTIQVQVYGKDHPNSSNPANSLVNINDVPFIISQSGRLCGANTLNAIAFDKDTGQPYVVLRTDGVFDIDDPLTCGPTPQVVNTFPNNVLTDITIAPEDSRMKQYVDGVKDEDYVLIFSLDSVALDEFREDVRTDLGRLAAARGDLRQFGKGEPIIIFGRKGFPEGTATIVRAEPIGGAPNRTDKQIIFEGEINASTDRGSISTIPIGPARTWGQLSHKIVSDPVEDVIMFDVIGVDDEGNETTLFDDISQSQLDLSSIDSDEYPYIRLYLNVLDEESATPPQLENWVVTYQGVPEGIVSLQNDENRNVQLQEGEPFNGQFRFTNISEHDFLGPLTVRYTFSNQSTGNEQMSTVQIDPVPAGESVDFELPIDTRGRVGLNDLEVFVNPGDEPEQFFNNNVLRLNSFYEVIRDNVNPAVDVTFDGVYILDGDVVSPSPVIIAELRDNNPYIFKEDTTGVNIYIRENCDNCEAQRMNFSDPNVNFFPATENSNFRVEFQPNSLADGSYNLRVEATDASGNQSGITPYNINFEVVNRSAISNFYPYPNPFSTSTRFVFTITGSELPEHVKIQIFTMSGKLVREITQAELGPIRIGNNITDYRWDGTDEFGDQLANGTYLYRVQVTGNSFEHFANRGDRGFRKGWGKLVILR